MTLALEDRVGALLRQALRRAATQGATEDLEAAVRRLDEPLRVALVGQVKAGKSTLLNAVVGAQVACTAVEECTQVVTWYRYGRATSAVVHPREGEPEHRPITRANGALRVDLGRPPEQVEHVDVSLPSRRLRSLTLIDTPGLSSLSTELGARTMDFLEGEGDRATGADAVVYLLRHLHISDVRFLETFHGDDIVQGTPLNTIGVLSRADEIGNCRLDAMEVAERVAERYVRDDRLRRLCPVVVPVNGLLAAAGTTLREDEVDALRTVASAARDDVLDLLLTAEGWASAPTPIAVPAVDRRRLLDRLGLYGVRLAVQLLRQGPIQDGAGLARALTERSGLPVMQALLATQFLNRAGVLKARTALAALDATLLGGGCGDAQDLLAEAEAVRGGAHEFEEVRLLHLLHAGRVPGRPERLAELERLLGGSGQAAAARLGLPAAASPAELRAASYAALTGCRTLEQQPLTHRELRRVARAAARSCEGLLHGLDGELELVAQRE